MRVLVFLGACGVFALPTAADDCLTLTETQELAGVDTEAGDNFGMSIAQDGGVLVVGARGDDEPEHSTGSAYIFRLEGGTWGQEQKLTASDGSAEDKFGQAVDISGDLVVIGAWGDESQRGAAYIFRYDGTTWMEQAKLSASDGTAGDSFGQSVAINGESVLIGARGFNDYAGAVYVYRQDGGGAWVEADQLQPADAAPSKLFGHALSVRGHRLVVGATGDATHAPYSGAAYIFDYSEVSGAWIEVAKVFPPDPVPFSYFGHKLSVDGALLAIGFAGPSEPLGRVLIYEEASGGSWELSDDFRASDTQEGDLFGSSVHLDSGKLVVAAAGVDNGAGALYLFELTEGSWTERLKMIASDGTFEDYLGVSCSRFGDHVLGGAYWSAHAGFRSGSVYVFDVGQCRCREDLNGDGWVGLADLLVILAGWGPCPGCPEDLDGDGSVGFADLLSLLNAWGQCDG